MIVRHGRLYASFFELPAPFAYHLLYAHKLFPVDFTQSGMNVTWRSVFLHTKNLLQSIIYVAGGEGEASESSASNGCQIKTELHSKNVVHGTRHWQAGVFR